MSRRNQRSQRANSSPADGAYIIPGRMPVAEALASRREIHRLLIQPKGDEYITELAKRAQKAGVPVDVAHFDHLDAVTKDVRHQGVVALAAPFPFVAVETFADAELVVVLDGITDPRNLGAIARVVEQVGAAGLVIRDRRAASPSPAAEKAAAGALSWVPIASVPNITRAIETLTSTGMWSIGLDSDTDSSVWSEPLMDERVVLVVGEEGSGLSRLVKERVDVRCAIPTTGRLDSLNASTAVAIAAFEWRRRHASEDQ